MDRDTVVKIIYLYDLHYIVSVIHVTLLWPCLPLLDLTYLFCLLLIIIVAWVICCSFSSAVGFSLGGLDVAWQPAPTPTSRDVPGGGKIQSIRILKLDFGH